MYCKKCGKQMTKHDMKHGEQCQACYVYYRNGGTDNPLPDKGRIVYDHRGYVVCHVCGRAYKRLGSHVKESHKMTIAEYKEKFGLCNCTRTTEKTYSQIMRENAYKHNMDKRLLETGKATRIKAGETKMRKGKVVRLQEILDKRNRGK